MKKKAYWPLVQVDGAVTRESMVPLSFTLMRLMLSDPAHTMKGKYCSSKPGINAR